MQKQKDSNPRITETSLALPLGPLYPDNIYDLIIWCRDYERRNKFPCTIDRRFAIGFYQIHQGMEWKDSGVNKFEGYAAASLHLLMTAERLGIAVDSPVCVKVSLKDFPGYDLQYKAYDLLKHLSKAQQQIIYASKSNKTKRASRYSAEKLTNALAQAILILISCIPIEIRSESFEAATTIMTKELK